MLVAGGGRGGKVGRVIVWDVKTGQQVLKVGQEYDTVLSADMFLADQATVAIGSPSKRIKLHDTADGELLHNIKKHSEGYFHPSLLMEFYWQLVTVMEVFTFGKPSQETSFTPSKGIKARLLASLGDPIQILWLLLLQMVQCVSLP